MLKEDIMQQIEPENISICSDIQPVVKILKWRTGVPTVVCH